MISWGSGIERGTVKGTGVLVRTELVERGTEVLRTGINLIGWLESDWIVLLTKVELVKIGKTGANWTEINPVINITGCLIGIELVDIEAKIS